jgi:two-component system, NtrC family, nitrogen regulation response regulator NtrX
MQQPADEPLVKQDLLALPLREAREQFERAYLLQQLQLCNGKVGQLAKRVGMERTHLYRKLRSLGVDFRPPSQDRWGHCLESCVPIGLAMAAPILRR